MATTMGKKNTVKVGVTDFYVAKATLAEETNKVTYGTPAVFGGTATVSVSVNKNTNKIYESDELIHNGSRITDIDITYTSRTVKLASEMEVLHGLDEASAETDGYLVGPDDKGEHYAVGYARKESDDSYTCFWYLWTEASKGDESDETATDSITSNPESYTFSASSSPEARADGKPQMKRIKKCKNATEMAAFFTSVLPST